MDAATPDEGATMPNMGTRPSSDNSSAPDVSAHPQQDVNIAGSQGVQVGPGGVQHITFTSISPRDPVGRWAIVAAAIVVIVALVLGFKLLGPNGEPSGDPSPSMTPRTSAASTPTVRPTATVRPTLLPPTAPSATLPDGDAAKGVTAISFNQDGSMLATGDANGSASLWDPAHPRHAAAHITDYSFACRSDTATTIGIIGGWFSGGVVGVLADGAAGASTPCTSATQGIHSIAFSVHGDLLVTADQNGYSYVWSTASKSIGKPAGDLHDPNSHGGVLAVAVSQNNKFIATGDGNGHVTLWTGGVVYKPQPDLWSGDQQPVTALAFSPDSSTLAVGDKGGATYLWTWNGGSFQMSAPLVDQSGQRVTSLAFSPMHGRLLATGDEDGSVYLYEWRAESQPIDWSWNNPDGTQVTSMTFSADDTVLAIGDADGKVYLYNVANPRAPRPIHAFTNPDVQGADPNLSGVTAVAFDPDNPVGTLAVGDANGKTYLWSMTWLP